MLQFSNQLASSNNNMTIDLSLMPDDVNHRAFSNKKVRIKLYIRISKYN